MEGGEEDEVVVLGEWSEERERGNHRIPEKATSGEPARSLRSLSDAAPVLDREFSSCSSPSNRSNASRTASFESRAAATIHGLRVAVLRGGGAARSTSGVSSPKSDRGSERGGGASPAVSSAIASPRSVASPREAEDDLAGADALVWKGTLEISRECRESEERRWRCEYCDNDMHRAGQQQLARGSSHKAGAGVERQAQSHPADPPPLRCRRLLRATCEAKVPLVLPSALCTPHMACMRCF